MFARKFGSFFHVLFYRHCFLMFLAICCCVSGAAQNSVIDEADRVPLKQNRHATTHKGYEVGRANPKLRMQTMLLLVAPQASLAAGAATESFPAAPRDPGLRQPTQGTGRGVSENRRQMVVTWLRSHGLSVEPTFTGPPAIRFRGTVKQVEETFAVEIHNYVVKGRTYYSNINPPSIPRAISGLVRAVNSLDDFPMQTGTGSSASPEIVLHQFTGTETQPSPGVMDSAGNFYGTTCGGGSTGAGTVFKVDTAGTQTVLYTFTGINGDGACPRTGLLMDSAGNFYGATYWGGANNFGTVFELDSAGYETILFSFADAPGRYPNGSLIMDSAGNLYGTANEGGAMWNGTVFELSPPAAGGGTWTLTVLYNFCSVTSCTDGEYPNGGLVEDSAGNLYGTALRGGSADDGTVFKISPPATTGGTWTETVLYNFCSQTSCTDGNTPNPGLVADSAGNLYGTTNQGGAANDGTVFELSPPATTGSWTYAVLHSFCSVANCTDGTFPNGGLLRDSAGNLYGTASLGGTNYGGTVFELSPPTTTGPWTTKVLYSFCSVTGCTDGEGSNTGLLEDSAGDLYGTTFRGGASDGGAVFELPKGSSTDTVVYSFPLTNGDGDSPAGHLFRDSAGNLYGITSDGGPDGFGTAFELSPPAAAGGTWTETVLHSFGGAGDGVYPFGALTPDSAGNLYGNSTWGGPTNRGTVFELSPPATAGGTWTETLLYSFTGEPDGLAPLGSMIMDTSTNFYGVTAAGGTVNDGTVFEVSPPATAGYPWTESAIYSFCKTTSCPDGEEPNPGLIMDTAGNLYGTTELGGSENVGVLYELSPKPASGCPLGSYLGQGWCGAVLHNFCSEANCTDGRYPNGALIEDSAGNLYGTTNSGGSMSDGVVFELSPPATASDAWTETVLYNFCSVTECTDGAYPSAGLLKDGAGNLYGTTCCDGAADLGGAFELSPPTTAGGTWTQTVLYNFTDGGGTYGLIMDGAGNLYGAMAWTELGSEAGEAFELLAQMVSLSSNNLSFSNQTIGTTSPAQTITLTNSGFAALAVSGVTITGTNAGDFAETNTCGTSVAAGGGTCTISVTFTPTAAGTRTASVSVADSASGSPQTIALSGSGASPDVGIQAAALSPGSVTPGQSSTATITLTSLNGFNSAVSLACTVSPTPSLAPTCSMNPTSVTPAANGTSTSALTVSTTAATAAMAPSAKGEKLFYALWLPLPLILVVGAGFGRRKSRWSSLVLCVVLATGVGSLVACGGGSGSGGSGGGGSAGTPSGSYTITVTATSGSSISHTTTLTLNVQ